MRISVLNNYIMIKLYEPVFSIIIQNGEDFEKNIMYSKNQKLSKRIRFFNYNNYFENPNDIIFIILYADDLIIGINKIVKTKTKGEKYMYNYADYVLSYFSIDRDFRNKKLSKFLFDAMFSWLKENGFKSVSSTEWTVVGKSKLKENFFRIGKKYDIKVSDKERTHDSLELYNDDLIHYDEMNEEETIKFDKKRYKKKRLNFMY